VLEVVSVADAVANELRRRLLAGEYAAGQELRDTELADELGAARPTVRAAVQTLVGDGLLERGRGRSARVRSFTAFDAVDLYRLRQPIEAAALRLVIEQRRPLTGLQGALIEQRRPLTGLQGALDAFMALRDDVSWDVVADHDIAFHRAMFTAAGSPRLLRTFNGVAAELRLLIAQLRPAYRGARELAQEHAVLLRVLQDGQLGPVLQAWHEHLDIAEQFFLDLIRERDR
jgi:DNA-binding GntR family transcriptional regulator